MCVSKNITLCIALAWEKDVLINMLSKMFAKKKTQKRYSVYDTAFVYLCVLIFTH